MSDLRKAAEDLLEAFDWDWSEPRNEALKERMEALRQALAQTEQESVICRNIYEIWAGSDGVPIPETIVEAYLLRLIEQMRDEASKGLKPLYTAPVDGVNISAERVDETAKGEHEPFIYVREDNERPFGGYEHCSETDVGAFPVYTAPMLYTPRPKREWVGLTVEEARKFYEKYTDREELIYAIDKFLEEKNT